jgi:phosphonopyruvate decarboxylase
MISPAGFCAVLETVGIDFYCGVPDSLLKNLCTFIDNHFAKGNHIITANEGNAVALALGRYLATSHPAVVYMQNSGLGNAINPLTSLADVEVYSVPMLLVIGWRGEPKMKDEPQHVKQGAITEQQLALLDIPYIVLDADSQLEQDMLPLLNTMLEQSRPVAVLVRKNTFTIESTAVSSNTQSTLQREKALETILSLLSPDDLVVSTTGKTSREVFEVRKAKQQINSDFLTVGGMGHTSSIAMGVALGRPERKVVAIDGDGSMLMHMGAMPIIGCHHVTNLVHIVLNNQAHESVGGQPTIAGEIDLRQIALASGYKQYYCAYDVASVHKHWLLSSQQQGPILFEIKIAIGSREDLGRPTASPIENKQQFMRHAGSL